MKKKIVLYHFHAILLSVRPKHVVGIDHEIFQEISEIDAGRSVPTQETFCFSTRPGSRRSLSRGGTIDFRGSRGPLDVLPVIIRAPYQTVSGPTRIPGFSPIGGLK
jgi:hypothetical protein